MLHLKPHHVPVIIPSFEEELELVEATRNKLHVKMNDSACVKRGSTSSETKGRSAKGQCPTPACPTTYDCVSSQDTGPSGPSNASNY
ncbi:hypothetical protein Tco_0388251, partial [Tanacetum coccineum]